jgi:dipeptidyl aminopeptidase/acylaminoacyl peptidase
VSQWAPDSSALYVLAEADSEIQVHRLSEARDTQITRDEADVESFRLSPDGRDLTYQTRNSREAIALAQRSEDAHGIRLDRTVVTDGLRLTDNYRIGEKLTTIRRLNADDLAELGRGDVRTKHLSLHSTIKPSAEKITPAQQPAAALHPQDAVSGEARLPLGASGITVILRQVVKGNVNGPMGRNRIEANLPGGKHVICSASFAKVLRARSGSLLILQGATRF